jgi:endonuclease/exonuclease/phosphatase family metal-dependent hydrolase
VHLGLFQGSRYRQIEALKRFIQREVPHHQPLILAGDFNDWDGKLKHQLALAGLKANPGRSVATFPSRWPMVQLDYIYHRGLQHLKTFVPQGPIWGRMSDHLPLITEFRINNDAVQN